MQFRPMKKRSKTAFLLTAAALVTIAMTVERVGAQAGSNTTTANGFSNGSFSIFRPFRDDDGKLQSLPAFRGLNGNNTFFKAFGTNQQTCATCHLPADGFTIHVQTIEHKFQASHGKDPLFRLNDTANRPDANPMTQQDREQLYSLIRELGVMRIGIVVPAPPSAGGTAEFEIETQTTSKFGTLPSLTDHSIRACRRFRCSVAPWSPTTCDSTVQCFGMGAPTSLTFVPRSMAPLRRCFSPPPPPMRSLMTSPDSCSGSSRIKSLMTVQAHRRPSLDAPLLNMLKAEPLTFCCPLSLRLRPASMTLPERGLNR